MEGYLGETKISVKGTPYEKYTPQDWALEYISAYGQIDGDHHKLWVLDQVARILKGTPIILKLAQWKNGTTEYRFSTGKPSKAYLDWAEEVKGKYDEENDEYEYDYDEGIAP